MYFLSVGEAIKDGFRSLMMTLCDVIYRLIIFFFNIFESLGTAEIFHNDTIQSIYQHIGLILGLFMVFRITFSAIEYLINPDTMMDKKKGFTNIVKKIIIVVVLLGVTPYLFDFAFDIQELIIKQNIIPKIITNQSISVDGDFGKQLSWQTFSSFYNINDLADPVQNEVSSCIETYHLLEKDLEANGTFRFAYNCLNTKTKYRDYVNTSYKEIDGYIVSFDGDGLLALIVGCIILWMIIMYTLQVGIRVIQLGYLQLIAPVPIMLYITPKGEERLNKWIKQCTSTYLDFFLRTAIIYFVVYIIGILISNDNNYFLQSMGNPQGTTATYTKIVMIIALLIFAKKVPDLFKELFPSSSGASKLSFGLNPKKELNNTLAAGLIGGAIGAVGAGASNAIHGFRNMNKAMKDNQVTMKKWKHLTDEERKGKKEEEYNKLRREQLTRRGTAILAAGSKGVASVAGGVLGGAKAGIKTKDISKSGEAVKTANANREKRELRTEAGYHWYNPLPSIGDKILEFSGDRTADDVKNRQKAIREAKAWEERLAKGERIFKYVNGDLADDDGKVKQGVFRSSEYIATWNAQNKAKRKVKNAKAIAGEMQRAATAAYSDLSGTEEEIKQRRAIADLKLTNAEKNLSAAEGELDIAKQRHAKNQELFSHDKETEELFNYYANTNKPTISIDKGIEKIINPQPNGNEIAEQSSGNEELSRVEKEYREAEQAYAAANKGVAEAIAKDPHTDKVKDAVAGAVEADKNRDVAQEKLAELAAQAAANANVAGNRTDYSKLNKRELKSKVKELENQRKELESKYNEIENHQNEGQKIDASQLSKIKQERQRIDKELEQIRVLLKNWN